MKKTEFTANVAQIVFQILSKSFVLGSGTEYRVKVKNKNCYITFHRYTDEFCILLYRSGDIELTFYEFCHSTYRFRYYEFNEEDDFSALFKQIKKDLGLLIRDYINDVIDYHVLCDYISGGWLTNISLTNSGSEDPLTEYKKIKKDYSSFC